MSRFSYTAILNSGQRVSGEVRGRTEPEVIRQLLTRGYHPIAIAPAAEQAGSWMRRWRRRVGTSALAVFTRQLAALLKAGLPLSEALGVLRRQCESRPLVRVLEDLQDSLSREGGTFAETLTEHPQVFSPIYHSLVRAGEEGGNLPEVLGRLAKYLSDLAKLRGQVLGAFIYPVFLLLLGVAAVLVLMTFVIPRFRELFDSFGRTLPKPTQWLIATSAFLATWWWALLLFMACLALAASLTLRRPRVRQGFHRLLLRMPVIGGMLLRLEVGRIARTLSALLTGGVGILASLRIVAKTCRNPAMSATFEPMAEGVAAGQALAEVLEKAKLYPPLMINLVRTGEETGELPEMLTELSQIYEDEAERAVTGAVKLLEPLLIILIGGVIAGIVAAIMLPIFQANAMVN